MKQTNIHILDDITANKIAAGEVVERPASVVKELVENAIDAQSRMIEVEIEDGGRVSIRVTDDGYGMNRQDAILSIQRHATSKLRTADDLMNIDSLGFRGEALPSIAAVSKFSLLTRMSGAEMAYYIEVHGGKIITEHEAGGSTGTTIKVEDLFYNTPARLKFLKTASTESAQINDIVGKLALSHPEISFKLINNNRMVLFTPGSNEVLDTLSSLYGHKIISEILAVNYLEEAIQVKGYLGKPTLLKSNRQWQTLIVNSRIVGSRTITKALDKAYHSLLPKIGFPLAVLSITLPGETVDINVHPQKSEVKFSDDQKVFRAIYKAITTTLAMTEATDRLAASSASNILVRNPHVPGFLPPVSAAYSPPAIRYNNEVVQQQQQMLYDAAAFIPETQPVKPTGDYLSQQSALPINNEPIDTWKTILQPLGQINECYIVAQGIDGLYIIDQHAAHERILYDRLAQQTERIPSQQLLVPLLFELDSMEISKIGEFNEVFYQLGFQIDIIGPNMIRLQEVPIDLQKNEIELMIREILMLLQESHNPSPHELRHACLQIAACRAAIKAGDPLNMRQIQALIGELCATDLPYTCPHGRPAIIRFSVSDLEKMFKRT